MKHHCQHVWGRIALCTGSLIFFVNLPNGIGGDAAARGTIPRSVWVSNELARTKEVFGFEQREGQRPRYDGLVTNWCPVITECGGITNITAIGHTTSEKGETRSYQGRDGQRFVSVTIHCMKSSRAAHEFLMESLALSPTHNSGEHVRDVDAEKGRIGDRQIDLEQGEPALNSLVFIRNNVYVSVTGFHVGIVGIAKELDRQILVHCLAKEDDSGRQ